jgi:hypothetical protein
MKEELPPHLWETMRIVVLGEDALIEYHDRFREYGIPYSDGSFQRLSYCPFDGVMLPRRYARNGSEGFAILELRLATSRFRISFGRAPGGAGRAFSC